MEELQGAYMEGVLRQLHPSSPTLCFTTDSELFAPYVMEIQHVTEPIDVISYVPPASLVCWKINSMLKVWGYMLIPSWGGVLLGGKGCVQCYEHGYGKLSIVICHMCTGIQVTYKKEKTYNLQNRKCNCGGVGIVLILLCRSDCVKLISEALWQMLNF